MPDTSDKLLTKISALLRKAENTDNEHEADAFLKAAQRLATQSSIDLAVARAHSATKGAKTTPIQRRIVLGEPGKRGLATYVALFNAVSRANDLTLDVAHNSTYVVAFGFADDIDVAEALYASLVVQMVAASDAYLRSGVHKTEKVWSDRQWAYVPISGSAARINFQAAFARRVHIRLLDTKTETVQTATETSAGTELVLHNKTIEVADFYKDASTAKGSYRPRSSVAVSQRSRTAGDAAGAKARLGAQTAVSGARTALR